MDRVLVTGGAGFIGSALCEILLRANYKVRVLDNFLRNHGEALIPFCSNPNFEFQKGDVTNKDEVTQALKGVDAIVHLASLVGAPICDRNKALTRLINVESTRLLLAEKGSRPFVFSSTGSVYGKVENGLCTEETPTNPLSIYAITKLEAEQLVRSSPNSTCLRFATAFGVAPNIRMDLLINDLAYKAVTERCLTIFQSDFCRTFSHVKDIAKACRFGIENVHKMDGKVYNVGDEDGNWTKRTLAEYLKAKTGCYVAYADKGYEDSDARNYEVSYRLIKSLGWSATISMSDGVDELLKVVPLLASSSFKNKL